MYAAKILADSIAPTGVRLTTMEITFPRFILAEINTHRALSRNSASSRAIPTEKNIERALQSPFIPEFNERAVGMGVGDVLPDAEQAHARNAWLAARNSAVAAAQALIHVDKSRANRLLEPFMWQTAIVSATDWANFFRLRIHPDAQPEFRILAEAMHAAIADSEPQHLFCGDWHLPLVAGADLLAGYDDEFWATVSAGRCARVSYGRQRLDDDTPEAASDRWTRLASSGHWSPAEHPARVPTEDEWGDRLSFHEGRWGNYEGWIQLRKHYDGEDVFGG